MMAEDSDEIEQKPSKGKKDKDEESEEEYNVFDFYKKESCWGKLAMNPRFEHATLAVISLNAIWIGIDADHNDSADIASARLEFVIAENVFCFYFSFEVIVRFLAFELKRSCLRDNWFRFDAVLVAFMILETWVMPMFASGGGGLGNLSILRLLRLLRLTRMARLMRSVPELLTLIKGMVAATRSVFSTLVLLILLMYVFGIIFTSTYKEMPEYQEIFGSMGTSMLVLFVQGTLLDDVTSVVRQILEHSQAMVWVFIVFILGASFTVLNMLIGVLCEIVSATAQAEQDERTIKDVKQRLIRVFEEIDVDGSGMISKSEFEKMHQNEYTLKALETLDVEPKHLVAMTDAIFANDNESPPGPSGSEELREHLCSVALQANGVEPSAIPETIWSLPRQMSGARTKLDSGRELSFDEFLEYVVHLRPGTQASVLDIADLRKGLRRLQSTMEMEFQILEESLEDIVETARDQVGGRRRSVVAADIGRAANHPPKPAVLPAMTASPRSNTASPRLQYEEQMMHGGQIYHQMQQQEMQPQLTPQQMQQMQQRRPQPQQAQNGTAQFRPSSNPQEGWDWPQKAASKSPKVNLSLFSTADILRELRLR